MSTDTKSHRRLYTASQLAESRVAWDTGHFSDEWRDWRHMAAMQAGIIVPPEGTEWDSWSDDEPSQRAMLIRAIRETPALLSAAIRSPGVHSWAAVIAVLLRGRDERRADRDREATWQERGRTWEPTPQEAAMALTRIRDLVR